MGEKGGEGKKGKETQRESLTKGNYEKAKKGIKMRIGADDKVKEIMKKKI